jgi:hypothetical protein
MESCGFFESLLTTGQQDATENMARDYYFFKRKKSCAREIITLFY